MGMRFPVSSLLKMSSPLEPRVLLRRSRFLPPNAPAVLGASVSWQSTKLGRLGIHETKGVGCPGPDPRSADLQAINSFRHLAPPPRLPPSLMGTPRPLPPTLLLPRPHPSTPTPNIFRALTPFHLSFERIMFLTSPLRTHYLVTHSTCRAP